MLPESYQGIGLPNFTLHSLASKLQLIQCIWGFNDAASRPMLMGYESFLMDIRMYGITLGYNYNWYSGLAMDNTWFNNFGNFYTISMLGPLLEKNSSYIQYEKGINP